MDGVVEVDAGQDGEHVGLQECDQQLERGQRHGQRERQNRTDPAEEAQGFLERNDERFKTEQELLKQKLDFTVDESIDDDPDKIDFPADKAEADERFRKRVKLDLPAQGGRGRRGRGGQQAEDPLQGPQPDVPPVRFQRAAGSLPVAA